MLIFFISIFFPPILFNNYSSTNSSGDIIDFNPNGFVWPTPGYTRINSYFGKRNAPTQGASTFHKGIDIGAPEGSSFIAVCDGEIIFANFLGGGGYTITLTTGNLKISYCHCNPNFMVHVGDIVKQGQIIRKCWSKTRLWCPRKPVSRLFRETHKWSNNWSTSTFRYTKRRKLC